MTPFQEALHERLVASKKMIDEIGHNNEIFRDEIDDVEQELEKADEKRHGKNPGIALRNLFTKWADEPYPTEEEFHNYKNELWMSLQQFERELKSQ